MRARILLRGQAKKGEQRGLSHSHRSDEQLDTSYHLVMQVHLQIRQPHRRYTEDDDIGDEVGDPSPKPASTCGCTLATGKAWRPCCSQWLALAEIV